MEEEFLEEMREKSSFNGIVYIPINNKQIKISVDNFFNKADFYFVSHAHVDHLKGINQNFDKGIIYATQITLDLLILKYNISIKLTKALPLNDEILLKASKG